MTGTDFFHKEISFKLTFESIKDIIKKGVPRKKSLPLKITCQLVTELRILKIDFCYNF